MNKNFLCGIIIGIMFISIIMMVSSYEQRILNVNNEIIELETTINTINQEKLNTESKYISCIDTRKNYGEAELYMWDAFITRNYATRLWEDDYIEDSLYYYKMALNRFEESEQMFLEVQDSTDDLYILTNTKYSLRLIDSGVELLNNEIKAADKYLLSSEYYNDYALRDRYYNQYLEISDESDALYNNYDAAYQELLKYNNLNE